MEDTWVHENHVARPACEFDRLHRDSEHVDRISHETALAINARVLGPQVSQAWRCTPDCFSDIFRTDPRK